jgi:hypothetical protein
MTSKGTGNGKGLERTNNGKDGGGFTFPPMTMMLSWMGHPFGVVDVERTDNSNSNSNGNGKSKSKSKSRSPSGMTNKRAGNDKSNCD